MAKVPRLSDGGEYLDREATSLRMVHQARPGGFDSIPRLVAHKVFAGEPFLLQTALTGRPMRAAVVRQQPARCLAAGLEWLLDLHRATGSGRLNTGSEFARLVEAPLAQLSTVMDGDAESTELLTRAGEIASTLRDVAIPLVCEHGDFSSPNLFLMTSGKLGVIDWELSERQGLPAVDLFFFLAYVASARASANTSTQCARAFRDAFWGARPWARPYIHQYAEAMSVPGAALRPLLVLCWTRYLANLAARMQAASVDFAGGSGVARLKQDRHFALWQHAVCHGDERGTW